MDEIIKSKEAEKKDFKADKPERKKNFYNSLFRFMDVNDPAECLSVLKGLNQSISFLWKLVDSDYYLDHIWNAGSLHKKELEKSGITENYFIETADRLSELRSILFGVCMDWEKLYEQLYHDLLDYEVYRNGNRDARIEQLEKRIHEMECRLKDHD